MIRVSQRLKRSKKGSIQDIAFIMVALVVFGVILLFGFKISNSFNDHIQADASLPSEAKSASADLTQNYPGIMDNVFLLFAIGLTIVSLTLAALVRVHPIFIPLFIIALIILVFVSGVLSNVYQELAATSQLSAEANQLTFVGTLLTILPFFVLVVGVILMIVLYKIGGEAG